jgi:ATP-dependent helicase/DNAse subunit B
MDFGSWLHAVLAEIVAKKQSGADIAEIDNIFLLENLRKCVDNTESESKYDFIDLLSETSGIEELLNQRGFLAEQFKKLTEVVESYLRFYENEQKIASFKSEFEKGYGEKDQTQIDLNLSSSDDGPVIQMRGTVDRIDIVDRPNGDLVLRIVDYKSGKPLKVSGKKDRVFDHFDFQIPTYGYLVSQDSELNRYSIEVGQYEYLGVPKIPVIDNFGGEELVEMFEKCRSFYRIIYYNVHNGWFPYKYVRPFFTSEKHSLDNSGLQKKLHEQLAKHVKEIASNLSNEFSESDLKIFEKLFPDKVDS